MSDKRDILEVLIELVKDCGDMFVGGDDLPETFEFVEEGDWELDYKYQTLTSVYRHEPTGRYFQIENTRSGSYHTDYNYQEPDVTEVMKKERVVTKTITEWIPV